jgi:NADPH:quinone reductase-like Zn-dependent oxidoreductase
MTFEGAACIAETYITAFQNLFLGARLIDCESVLLHGGGGGVNTAAVQIVRALSPASRIFVTASTRKLDRVRALGADHVIDYSMQDFAELVLEQSKGGVDVILDHIGAAYLERNLSCLAINGRLAIIAVMGGATAELNLARLMVRRQSILGSVLRPRPVSDKADIIARFRDTVLPFFVRGEIVPVIDSVYPLADVVAAHQRMEASEHFGKIVLSVNAKET